MSWMNKINVALRLLIISVVLVLALAGLSTYFLNMYKKDLLTLNKDRVMDIVEISEGVVEYFYKLEQKGLLSQEEAQKEAKEALRDVRYSGTDYIFVYTTDGTNLVTGPAPEKEGTNLLSTSDINGVLVIKELIDTATDKDAFVEYVWDRGDEKNVPKISYSLLFEEWDWMIGSGVYVDDVDKRFMEALRNILTISSSIFVIAGIITFGIAMSISKPLSHLTGDMEKLSAGDYNFEVKFTEFKDEIGTLARALAVFRENAVEMEKLREEQKLAEARQAEERQKAMNDMANSFEEKVGGIVLGVSDASRTLGEMAAQLAAGIEEASRQSGAVAGASEEASANVQTVAAATEELSASIREISQNITETASAANECATRAEDSKEKLQELQNSVGKIDNVLKEIIEVAEQTNLLALNATIEAARAGDAGKGFAVVASEVKELATKTQNMTDEIAILIQAIKDGSGAAIGSVEDIMKRIEGVTEKTSSVAAAVEQQNNSTVEISRNVQEASIGTREVSSSIQDVQTASNQSASATSEVKDSAVNLAQQANDLKSAVDLFIAEIRS